MSLRDSYESDAGRGLEVVCGLALLLFALPLGAGAVLLAIRAPWSLGAFVTVAILGVLAWGLGLISMRLLRGRGRSGSRRELFPPVVLMIGAAIFLVGGALLLFLGIKEHRPAGILGGIGIIPASYYAWRIALARRKPRDA